MTKSLREVLKERDRCTDEAVDRQLEQWDEICTEALTNGTDIEEAFEDFFGLEPDYLLETFF